MQAEFPVCKLQQIISEPNLHELLKTLKIVCRCSQTTKSTLGPLGYLFVALPGNHYARYTTMPLVVPPPTAPLPTYLDETKDGVRDRVKLEWQGNIIENNNIDNMNEALITLLLTSIQPALHKHLDHDLVSCTASKFWEIFNYFLIKYRQVTPIDLENNKDQMKDPYDTETPIKTLFGQINDANKYIIFAKKPMQ